MFTAWGGRKVSEYWGNVFRCGKSGFTVNRGAVNRGFTVMPIEPAAQKGMGREKFDRITD